MCMVAVYLDEEKIMEVALEAGADDIVTNDDGSIDVMTPPESFMDVKESMVAAGLEPAQAEITMHPMTTTELDLETAQKVVKLVEILEDLDDVQNVYSNADFSSDVMAQL